MTELEDTSRYVFSKNVALITADAKPVQNIDIREHRQVLWRSIGRGVDHAVEHTDREFDYRAFSLERFGWQ